MATTEKTNLAAEAKAALTDPTIKSRTSTNATGTKRGRITEIARKSAASWVLLGLLSIIPSN
jgi:hypothetical protein